MTYLFESSVLCSYFNAFKIPFIKKSIVKRKDGYVLVDYFKPDTSVFADKIHITDSINTGRQYRNNQLSASWFKRPNNNSKIKDLKKDIQNYFRNIVKTSSEQAMWTTFKDYQSKLEAKGYKKAFVQCKCRGTNEYADRSNLVYALNVFHSPVITRFFSLYNVHLEQDLYALSEMLQWIWRSRIRKGEPINIYIPSERMSRLLQRWIDGDI